MKAIAYTIDFSHKHGDSIPSFDIRGQDELGAVFWVGRNIFTTSEAEFLLIEQGATRDDARDRVAEAATKGSSMLVIHRSATHEAQ